MTIVKLNASTNKMTKLRNATRLVFVSHQDQITKHNPIFACCHNLILIHGTIKEAELNPNECAWLDVGKAKAR